MSLGETGWRTGEEVEPFEPCNVVEKYVGRKFNSTVSLLSGAIL